MLELEGVRKCYASPGGPVHALDGLHLSVAARELVAVFGPSGSGKTTLLLLAAGLLRADSGRVSFAGADLARMDKREMLAHRRNRLGFVFQDFNLVAGLTATENAALPLLLRATPHREAHARARALLAEVGLADRAEHTPAELSGGERQRVAIARALVGEPELILADEPTGNLDSGTGDAVLELLSTLPRERGAAIVLVTHDARVCAYADRVLEMRDGRLSAPNSKSGVDPAPDPDSRPGSDPAPDPDSQPDPNRNPQAQDPNPRSAQDPDSQPHERAAVGR